MGLRQCSSLPTSPALYPLSYRDILEVDEGVNGGPMGPGIRQAAPSPQAIPSVLTRKGVSVDSWHGCGRRGRTSGPLNVWLAGAVEGEDGNTKDCGATCVGRRRRWEEEEGEGEGAGLGGKWHRPDFFFFPSSHFRQLKNTMSCLPNLRLV